MIKVEYERDADCVAIGAMGIRPTTASRLDGTPPPTSAWIPVRPDKVAEVAYDPRSRKLHLRPARRTAEIRPVRRAERLTWQLPQKKSTSMALPFA